MSVAVFLLNVSCTLLYKKHERLLFYVDVHGPVIIYRRRAEQNRGSMTFMQGKGGAHTFMHAILGSFKEVGEEGRSAKMCFKKGEGQENLNMASLICTSLSPFKY